MPGTEVSSGDENIGGSVSISSGTVNVGNRRDVFAEVLCDTVTTFLRRFQEDAAGVVTRVDTSLDGTSVYVPVGAVSRCSQPISGTVSISNLGADDELENLCDSGAAGLPFLRQYAYPPGGGAPVVSNFTLDGVTPYVVVGPVTRCNPPITGAVSVTNLLDDEYEVLCDSTPTTFLRRLRTDAAGVVTVTDLTLAGGAFVPVGAVGLCPGVNAQSNRRDTFDEVLCDSTPTTFLRRYTVNDAGVVTITNTTLDGTTAFVPVGAVSWCAGDVRNDETQVMVDFFGPFLRRYSWNAAGVLTVTNLTLAGAAYVPVGTVTYAGGRNTSSVTITLLTGVASFATSATARRVTFIFGSADAVAASRPSINGVATLQSPTTPAEQIQVLVFGDLGTGGFLPSMTFATNLAGDTANVIQEF